jgi:hypothetical protein
MATIQDAKTELAKRLISLIRFENEPGCRLEGTEFPNNDSEKIRKATALYFETWVVPYLWALAHDACTNAESGLVNWRKFESLPPFPKQKDAYPAFG